MADDTSNNAEAKQNDSNEKNRSTEEQVAFLKEKMCFKNHKIEDLFNIYGLDNRWSDDSVRWMIPSKGGINAMDFSNLKDTAYIPNRYIDNLPKLTTYESVLANLKDDKYENIVKWLPQQCVDQINHQCKYDIDKNTGHVTFYPSPYLKESEMGKKKLKQHQINEYDRFKDCEVLFDNKCNIIENSNNLHAFIQCILISFYYHYPLIIKPSNIHLLICQSLAFHLQHNDNAQKLKDTYVKNEEKNPKNKDNSDETKTDYEKNVSDLKKKSKDKGKQLIYIERPHWSKDNESKENMDVKQEWIGVVNEITQKIGLLSRASSLVLYIVSVVLFCFVLLIYY